MKTALVAATALLLLADATSSLAENELPTTNVTGPKQKPARRPAANNPAPTPNANITGPNSAGLPNHPDPQYPNIGVKDWNAPGMLNLHTMTDAQFAQFQAMHPTTAFYGRCYSGQDPDPNIRGWLRRWRPIHCEIP